MLNIKKIISRFQLRHAVLLAVLLFMPALLSPFYSDDFFHLLVLEESLHENRLNSDESVQHSISISRNMPGSIWGLFAFVDDVPEHTEQLRQFSLIPWWADPEFNFRFWRPVAELSHGLDYGLFPRSAFFAHAHSLAWFILLMLVFTRFVQNFQSVFDQGIVGKSTLLLPLSLLIFVLDGQHVATVSWVANRNALMAAVFGLFSVSLFLQALDLSRTTEKSNTVIKYSLALLFYALALLCAEAAIAISGFYFALVICLWNFKWHKSQPVAQKLLRALLILAPYALLTLVWMAWHQWLGYGAEPSGNSYINPFAHPLQFLALMLERVPVYFVANLTSSPAGSFWTVGNVYDWFATGYWVAGLICMLLAAFLLKRHWLKSPVIVFSIVSFCVAAIPASLANPQDRLAIFLSIPAALFFAQLILWLFDGKAIQSGFSRAVLIFLLFTQLLISPLHLIAGGLYMRWEASLINQQLTSMDIDQKKHMVLLNLPIGYNVMLTGVRGYFNQPLPKSSFYLGNDAGELSIQRTDGHSFEIRRSDAFATGHEQYFRNEDENPYRDEGEYEQAHVKVEVLGFDDDGFPNHLMMTLDKDFALDKWQFFAWVNGGIQVVELGDWAIQQRKTF